MVIESIASEYQRYKSLAEIAVSQVEDDDLHQVISEDANSIAVIMNHISGNLKSRFTNFLTEDGEKSWRNRDEEFEEKLEARTILLRRWNESWKILLDEIDSLKDSDLGKVVTIRGKELRYQMHYRDHWHMCPTMWAKLCCWLGSTLVKTGSRSVFRAANRENTI